MGERKKAMETIPDLIEEAKVRTVWWGLCIFAVTYFLTHASTCMWMNVPIAILIVCGLRILSNEVELHWKARPASRHSYLSNLKKKQLSLEDPRLSTAPPPPKWKKKIDSPIVEEAINDFIDKILRDFVVDLWYSEITEDKDAPELIRAVIMDALGEISLRVKEINIVKLLTRDIVDLIGDHLELFRQNQATIGIDVMKTLSSEERDERLKYHLMVSGELYPALLSPENEYKVLQKIVVGILSVVLRPRETQCPLVPTIAREIVTCLVVQPLLNLVCPKRINEVIEIIINIIKAGDFKKFAGEAQSGSSASLKGSSFNNQVKDKKFGTVDEQIMPSPGYDKQESSIHQHSGEWARMLEAATQKRTEVLAPENLENLWTKGRNYKKREYKKSLKQKGRTSLSGTSKGLPPRLSVDNHLHNHFDKSSSYGRICNYDDDDSMSDASVKRLQRSNSTSDVKGVNEEPLISDFVKHNEKCASETISQSVSLPKEGHTAPKLKCRVLGAYFEKLGSKSFAVYSITVTDAENKTWLVKRRYSNFEQLHRQLKDIPNYSLHLPPKRIFSSSTEDAFVHQRCVQLDKYLQNLLSIANVVEQHEVWDFLSASSKIYSFEKSSSVMKTLADNVDDAVDDIVHQLKGVSDGLKRKVVPSPREENAPVSTRHLSLSAHDLRSNVYKKSSSASHNISSDDVKTLENDCHMESRSDSEESRANGWHSDNELNSKNFPPRVIRRPEKNIDLEVRPEQHKGSIDLQLSDPSGMPPEWTPPNVSVPMLNLVDKVFQLNRRGWLRRQVFWISKQILQLVMEDTVDDWLLRQICWLRNEDTVAKGIRWAQDILWPNGVFFTHEAEAKGSESKSNESTDTNETPLLQIVSQFSGFKGRKSPNSFEHQLEAARRASEIKKFLLDGAPTALVGLVGNKQYRKCARDIFYFTQSSVCMKQVAYSILEMLLRSVLPELNHLLTDIRTNTTS